MAIIYSYPPNESIQPDDILVCTSRKVVAGKIKNQTKSLSIQNLTTYINTSSTNDLDQVLSNGNISLLNANIGQLGLWDAPNGAYANVSMNDGIFTINNYNGIPILISDSGYTFVINNGNAAATFVNSLTTTSRGYTLPDQDGTLALIEDILPPPGLDDVLLIGNSSIIDAKVGKLYLYNPLGGRPYMSGDKNAINFYSDAGSYYGRFTNNEVSIQKGLYPGKMTLSTLTDSRTYTFPDKDGTVAMLSDVTGSLTLQDVTNNGATTTNSIIITDGTSQKSQVDNYYMISGDLLFNNYAAFACSGDQPTFILGSNTMEARILLKQMPATQGIDFLLPNDKVTAFPLVIATTDDIKVGVNSNVLPPPGGYLSNVLTGLAVSTTGLIGTSDRITLSPYIPAKSFTSSSLAVKTTVAPPVGALYKILIYSDVNGVPTTLLYDSGSVTPSGVLVIETPTVFQFKQGVCYWIGLVHNSTPATVTIVAIANLISIGLTSAFVNQVSYTSNVVGNFNTPPLTLPSPVPGIITPPLIGIKI